jgi:heme exporter protein D
MMPDLATHAGTVLGAYAVTLVLIALIVGLSWARAVRVRRRLAAIESRAGGQLGVRRSDGQAET